MWGVKVLDVNRIAKNRADILDAKIQVEKVVSVDKEIFLSDKRNSLISETASFTGTGLLMMKNF